MMGEPSQVIFYYLFRKEWEAQAFAGLVALMDDGGNVRTTCGPGRGDMCRVGVEMVPTDRNIKAFARFLPSGAGSRYWPDGLVLYYTFSKPSQARAFVQEITLAYPDGNVWASCNPGDDREVRVGRDMLPGQITYFESCFSDFVRYLSPKAESCLLGFRRRFGSHPRAPGSFEGGRRR